MKLLRVTPFFLMFLLLYPPVFSQEEQDLERHPDEIISEDSDDIDADSENIAGPVNETEEGDSETADPDDDMEPEEDDEEDILKAVLLPPAEPLPISERHLNILMYGTDAEIATLIQTLRNEKDTSLDGMLFELAETSKNKTILTGILNFFSEREKDGLEDRAMTIIRERDFEANETVFAAVDYLGRVNASEAVSTLRELINSRENRFMNNAIRAMGRAGKGNPAAADEAAQFLLEQFRDGSHTNDNQREIIIAIGETGSSLGLSLLTGIVSDNGERLGLRMAALDALGKIGDPAGLNTIIEAVSAADPNVRSTAIAALGPFSGEEADRAILEGFRDSYYRTRIGSAQAAGRRKMEAAVPFLRFRAENDDVAVVKDEAIKALGAIWNSEAVNVLETLFFDRKLSDRIRVLAGEMLLTNNAAAYSARAIIELDDSKSRNQNALYNGILRIIGPGISIDLESLAARFLATGTITEKSFALDMAANNNFVSLEEGIRLCLDERRNGAGLARKAQSTLEKLGLN